jgi:hypothetical protein
LDETTTGQVNGAITSDPITSLTDGELFVDSGTLTAPESKGALIDWAYENAPAVSLQAEFGLQTTVPSDETWLVAVICEGTSSDKINGTEVSTTGEKFYIDRIVFDGDVSLDIGGSAFVQGFDVSNATDLTPVSTVGSPITVPSDETWVGTWFIDDPELNGSPGAQVSTSYPGHYKWVTLSGGDELQKRNGGSAYFGGFKV